MEMKQELENSRACEPLKNNSNTFPTAASPRRTSFTLLLGFGAAPDMVAWREESVLCLPV
jgi:hypothetical protein